jgi:hypothetical protein
LALSIPPGDVQQIIALILSQNEIVQGHLRDRLYSVREIPTTAMMEPNGGMNKSIINPEGCLLKDHEVEVLRNLFVPQKRCQFDMLCDRLAYALIFWNGFGGCDIHESDELQGSETLMRKILISLILQPCDHIIHQLPTP